MGIVSISLYGIVMYNIYYYSNIYIYSNNIVIYGIVISLYGLVLWVVLPTLH